jgi:vacuolar-type H+-ATPase subunit H
MTDGRAFAVAASAIRSTVHAGSPIAAAAMEHTRRNSRRLTPRLSRRFNKDSLSSSFSIGAYLLLSSYHCVPEIHPCSKIGICPGDWRLRPPAIMANGAPFPSRFHVYCIQYTIYPGPVNGKEEPMEQHPGLQTLKMIYDAERRAERIVRDAEEEAAELLRKAGSEAAEIIEDRRRVMSARRSRALAEAVSSIEIEAGAIAGRARSAAERRRIERESRMERIVDRLLEMVLP